MRILIVDDDAISLEILENALVKAGYDVATASDGEEALQMLRSEPLRLVISDWDMPRLNGLDLCRAVRSDDVDAEFIRLIYQTSPLHDIGKVGIPDCVLLKPGQFNAAEFEIMQQHTQLGANTLEAALEKYPEARFLKIARDIALTHHERYD